MNYSTSFPATENPISESGNWINATDAPYNMASFSAVQTGVIGGTHCAFATQNTSSNNDSTAWLSGTWGQYQQVQGTFKQVNANFQEVELLIQFFGTAGSPGSCSGYEWDIFNNLAGSGGFNYVRYDANNGANSSFTFLVGGGGAGGAAFDFGRLLVTGDVLAIKNNGTGGNNSFDFYLNGTKLIDARFPVVDNMYKAGAPGIGMFIDTGAGQTGDGDMGWSAFTATDGATTTPPILVAAWTQQSGSWGVRVV